MAKICIELRLADATLEIQLTQQIENAGGSAATAAVAAAVVLLELQKVLKSWRQCLNLTKVSRHCKYAKVESICLKLQRQVQQAMPRCKVLI